MEIRKNEGKPIKLTWRLTQLLLFCWLLPLGILTTSMLYFVSQQFEEKTVRTIEESVENAVDICEFRIKTAINSSRQASYSDEIRNSWERYQQDQDFRLLREEVKGYLEENYRFQELFKNTILYFTEEPGELFFTFNTGADKGYESIRYFQNEIMDQVHTMSRGLDTGVGFLMHEGSLYLVRNMMRSDYVPFAVLVMELDTNIIFQSLHGIVWYKENEVYIDGREAENTSNSICMERIPESVWKASERKSRYLKESSDFYVCRDKDLEGHEFRYLVHLDVDAITYEKEAIKYVVLLLFAFSLPLIIMIYLSLHNTVSVPVNRLIHASREISKGNFGFRLEDVEVSEEFLYLQSAFNTMSDTLKNQFEKIYQEELALRDANIKALQSQINPHFLNNTLEIVNWEARMGNNDKVGRMIDALSTMLKATMNRRKQQMIPLREELEYVNAYFYIIKQRFGEKIQFIYEVEPEFLKISVPRLIVQPIVENAVEHGLKEGAGTVELKVYEESEYLKIEVGNSGELTEEDQRKIDKLLENSEQGTGGNLGIRNVDRRLKVLYGPQCGLTITRDYRDWTVSTITIHQYKLIRQNESNNGKDIYFMERKTGI